MKYLSFLALIILATACGHSKRGSGNIVTEKRTTEPFMVVHAEGMVHVHVKKGPELSVTVEADDNIIPYIETKVSGSSLKVRLRELSSLTNVTINVYVTAPELKGINASDGAELTGEDTISSKENIVVKSSGGATLKATVDAPSVTIEADGGGSADVSGRTKTVNATSTGGSSVHATGLLAENVTADANGGASIELFASVSLNGNASGGGKIEYTGGAKDVKKNESGGGSVNPE